MFDPRGSASLLVLVLVTAAPAADPAVVLSENIFDEKPTPQCHASTIAETPSGLVAAWFAGVREGTSDVGIWVSRHVAGKWSKPIEAFNGVQPDGKRHPTWNPVLAQQPGGPLHLFFKVGPSPSTWWGMHATSADGGRTWSNAVRLPGKVLGPIKNKPVLLPDGVLLSGSSTEERSVGWRVIMERTADWGRTWEQIGPLNDESVGAIQPTIFRWGPGRLQVLCRTRGTGRVGESWSADEGKTWSPFKLTTMPNPNSGIDGVMLREGRGLLVYNHTPRGRSPINVAVSADGRDWKAGLILADTAGREFSYPAIIQSADGLVHVTYTDGRERVRHVVIDPTKLAPRPFVDGEWPG